MKLLTESIREQILANGRQQDAIRGTEDEIDFRPVVKLFTPDAACTWLLTEIDPENPDIAFGLCDLGMGMPELGSVSLAELESVRGRLGLRSSATCISRRRRLSRLTRPKRSPLAGSRREEGCHFRVAALCCRQRQRTAEA